MDNINVFGSIDKHFNSEKFLKLRLKVCHDKLNKNGSYFTLESINNAKDSITLIPILANVIEDANGEYQFGSHDILIETNAFDENKTKIIYQEVPIGFIPLNCNYEVITEDDKNYVLVDGYVWKEYCNYAQEIIERDEVINLSMEISVDEFKNLEFENGNVVPNITQFKYTGITLLGNDIKPAMEGACAKLMKFNSTQTVTDVIATMSTELESIFKVDLDELESNVKINDDESKINDSSMTDTPTSNFVDNCIDNNLQTNSESNQITVGLTCLNSIGNVIQKMLLENDDNHNIDLIVITVNDDEVMYYDYKEQKFYTRKYSCKQDIVSFLGNPEEKKYIFMSDEEFTTYNSLKDDYSKLQVEAQELRQFKLNVENKEIYSKKIEVIKYWEDLLSNNLKFDELKENINEISLEDLSIKCKCIYADEQIAINNKKNIKESDTLINFSFSPNNQINDEKTSFIKKFSK